MPYLYTIDLAGQPHSNPIGLHQDQKCNTKVCRQDQKNYGNNCGLHILGGDIFPVDSYGLGVLERSIFDMVFLSLSEKHAPCNHGLLDCQCSILLDLQ